MNVFNTDIEKVLREIEFESVRETITDWFYDARTDEYIYKEDGMFFVIYDLCNYDIICLRDGKICTTESNHPHVAEIISKYASEETLNKVNDRLYERVD